MIDCKRAFLEMCLPAALTCYMLALLGAEGKVCLCSAHWTC